MELNPSIFMHGPKRVAFQNNVYKSCHSTSFPFSSSISLADLREFRHLFIPMSLSIFIIFLVSIPLSIHAVPEPRGVLLNCGGEAEESGGLKYITDEGFIKTGNKSGLKQPNLLPILQTLRYFPNANANKYCYNFQVFKGAKFLVKTIYYYGGYDGGKEPPVFDQIIDGTKWSTVDTREDFKRGLTSYYEVIVVAQNKVLSLCLARNSQTTSSPFISAIELQYLESSLYNSTNFDQYALVTVARSNFGSSNGVLSYPDDTFNRYWQPYTDKNYQVESSQSNVTLSEFWNIPPVKAFSKGMTSGKGKTLTLKWPPFELPGSLYYIALYFQENRAPSPYSWRVFDIHINGQKYYSNLNVTTSGVTVYGTEWPLKGETEVSLIPKTDMPVGPIINAGEVFQILVLGKRTVTRDVMAMDELAWQFENPPEDWVGDPCLPKDTAWTGVTCSDGKAVRVLSVNLTGFGISGVVSENIFTLTALKHLWLGHNELSGKIPALDQLKSLETLHLESNEFEGAIPDKLGELPNLREAYLQHNNLNGTLPQSLRDNKKIKLDVAGNNLS